MHQCICTVKIILCEPHLIAVHVHCHSLESECFSIVPNDDVRESNDFKNCCIHQPIVVKSNSTGEVGRIRSAFKVHPGDILDQGISS